jgi:hypothetical protein
MQNAVSTVILKGLGNCAPSKFSKWQMANSIFLAENMLKAF